MKEKISKSADISHAQVKKQLLTNPAVRKEYEALEPQFQLIRQLVARRNELNLNQARLASTIGTKQPAISRFEHGDINITLATLYKIADALDVEVNLSFLPKEKVSASERKRTPHPVK